MSEAADTFTPQLWLVVGVELTGGPFNPDAGAIFTLRRASSTTASEANAATFRVDYTAKIAKGLDAGAIYEIETSETGDRIRLSRARWRGLLQPAEERQAISVADRANRAALDARKRRERLAKDDLDLPAILGPLVPHYRKCRTTEASTAFELMLLTALRKAAARPIGRTEYG